MDKEERFSPALLKREGELLRETRQDADREASWLLLRQHFHGEFVDDDSPEEEQLPPIITEYGMNEPIKTPLLLAAGEDPAPPGTIDLDPAWFDGDPVVLHLVRNEKGLWQIFRTGIDDAIVLQFWARNALPLGIPFDVGPNPKDLPFQDILSLGRIELLMARSDEE